MKQDKLVKKIYKACIEHNDDQLAELRKKEFRKIFKRKEEGKSFGPNWTLVNL
jgi:hypothetical protein